MITNSHDDKRKNEEVDESSNQSTNQIKGNQDNPSKEDNHDSGVIKDNSTQAGIRETLWNWM
jgi:hypothetical protein